MTETGVVIIGAGFAGIGMAIRLKQAGWNDFVILEQADQVGGTWRDNTYPGCACDIPSHLYSLSFAPSAEWSRRYPSQPELLAYLEACIDRFDLRPHLRLGVCLERAGFDAESSLWRLETAPGPDWSARFLVLAMGVLHRPAMPPLPGLESFQGALFHSARWDHATALRGARVGVIGTGASAAQLVPRVVEQAAQVVLFQRTPAWVLPKHDPLYRPSQRWALRRVPMLRRALRAWLYWTHEARVLGFVWLPRLMGAAERRARSYAKRQLHDDALRAALTPTDRIGCRRIVLSNDFLPSLERSNVQLVTTPIERVASDAVVTADGVHLPIDVLVCATGFRATEPMGAISVTGRDGVTLSEAWSAGAPARLGLAVAGFPNMFLLAGPNTGLGHNSVVFMLEAQIGHVMRCLRLVRHQRAASIELRAAAQARFMQRLQRWMQRSVWLTGCRSWYLDRNGRNTTLWPGFTFGYWWRTRFVSQRHYELR